MRRRMKYDWQAQCRENTTPANIHFLMSYISALSLAQHYTTADADGHRATFTMLIALSSSERDSTP